LEPNEPTPRPRTGDEVPGEKVRYRRKEEGGRRRAGWLLSRSASRSNASSVPLIAAWMPRELPDPSCSSSQPSPLRRIIQPRPPQNNETEFKVILLIS
jgi:hypothetical protein